MRGQLGFELPLFAPVRIIPARAGPTVGSLPQKATSPDHPRSCGASMFGQPVRVELPGSSPLVRGQHQTDESPLPQIRIIPARAGPTYSRSRFPAPRTDHPRSCGANVTPITRFRPRRGSSPLVRGQRKRRIACRVGFGSSPLVRGQRLPHPLMRRQIRIIPARAGPTRSLRYSLPPLPDHPRSCGAN